MTAQPDESKDKPPELPSEVNELLDRLIAGYQKPADILGENGLLKQLTKALVERALEAEMTHHLGYGLQQICARRQEQRELAQRP